MDLVQITTKSEVTAYVESRIGGRSENQDSNGWHDTPLGFLMVVCDGMGGGPAGKTASSIAVSEIVDGVVECNAEETPSNVLIKAIRRANMAILAYSNEHPQCKGMGSTCVALLIGDACATVAHVGDSRLYQVRGKNKVFRTFDHSMVFDLVRQKVISEEQARLSAQSNVITRALGAKYDVEVDVVELPYLSGDRFVLTTDGIHGALPEAELVQMFACRSQALGAVLDSISTTVDGLGVQSGGGHDNLTIAIVETNTNSTLKTKMNKTQKIMFGAICLICLASLCLNFVLYSRLNAEASDPNSKEVVQPLLPKSDSVVPAHNAQADVTKTEPLAKDTVPHVQKPKSPMQDAKTKK